MLVILAAAATLAAAPPARPAALTGGAPAAYAAWLQQRTLAADRAFGGDPCPTAVVRWVTGRPLRSAEIAAWSGSRQPTTGPVWFERLRMSGCGRSTVHNFQVTRLRRGGWEAMGMLPGEAVSTPRQQTERMQSLAAVILNGAPALPCGSSEALRTMTHGEVRVVSAAAVGVWTERWPIQVCGVDRTVEVTFAPTGAPRIVPAWSG